MPRDSTATSPASAPKPVFGAATPPTASHVCPSPLAPLPSCPELPCRELPVLRVAFDPRGHPRLPLLRTRLRRRHHSYVPRRRHLERHRWQHLHPAVVPSRRRLERHRRRRECHPCLRWGLLRLQNPILLLQRHLGGREQRVRPDHVSPHHHQRLLLPRSGAQHHRHPLLPSRLQRHRVLHLHRGHDLDRLCEQLRYVSSLFSMV